MKSREQVTTNGRAVFFAAMWEDFRKAAMDYGWALSLHGSLATDMDIMAMPWSEEASDPKLMIHALRCCFDKPEAIKVDFADMPNHRRVYTLSIWADFYLDINIIKFPAEALLQAWNDGRDAEYNRCGEFDPEKYRHL